MRSKFIIAAISLLFFFQAHSQEKTIPNGYAVVVGAYSLNKKEVANKFARQVDGMGYQAKLGLNIRGSLILVYVDHTPIFKEAISKMKAVREKQDFQDAWVHVVIRPESVDKPTKKEVKAAPSPTVITPVKEEVKTIDDENEESNITEPVKGEELEVAVEEPVNVPEKSKEQEIVKDGRLSIHFNLINSVNNKPIKGEVQIIDAERSKLLDVAESGVFQKLDDPKNGTGRLTLLADVFGFRKLQKEINYYEEEGDDAVSSEEGLVVDFEMVRYHKGDIVTMYNVFFFKDAAVMRPESKYEVSNLLDMLNENENVRIKIHGHVNGNHPGEIISVDGKNYFSLTDNCPKGFGSAKELSKQRAEVIRDFLINEGVSPDRMEIKAWGGKRMLHDKHSNQAKYNVRVEIEILSE